MSIQDKLYEYIGKQARDNYIYVEVIMELQKRYRFNNYDLEGIVREVKAPPLENFIQAQKNLVNEFYIKK